MQSPGPHVTLIDTYPVYFPPLWASGWGEDQYGLYADFTIDDEKDLIQRFRWIAPGEFMMGLPKDDPERLGWEDYHRVTLTHGCWLADTTLTQAVWKAVMGGNPSHFENDLNPVENVNWGGAVSFIDLLNKQFHPFLGELVIRLPTEAEWEHACRAGTDTPFSFGENITQKQVNYNGDYPYAAGKRGEYRKKTVPVKSLPVNPWGLYEMHGNVWEWCADTWQKNLGEEPVIDPFCEEPQAGSVHVLRGGSWSDLGGRVRSAFRDHYSPGYRFVDIGFRLALGHVSSSRGSERCKKG